MPTMIISSSNTDCIRSGEMAPSVSACRESAGFIVIHLVLVYNRLSKDVLPFLPHSSHLDHIFKGGCNAPHTVSSILVEGNCFCCVMSEVKTFESPKDFCFCFTGGSSTI